MQVTVKSQFIVFWGYVILCQVMRECFQMKETANTSFKAYEIFGTEILTRSDLDSQSNWFNREKSNLFSISVL